MKKVFYALLVAVLCLSMIFSFTACNGNTGDGGEAPSSSATADNSGSTDSSTNSPDSTPTNAPAGNEGGNNAGNNSGGSNDSTPVINAINGVIWNVTELDFTTTEKYVTAKGEQGTVEFFCDFTHKETGKTMTIPGFWYEGNTFKVRFAPILTGLWEYKTICETDASLAGKTGAINAAAYTGDLDVYKHGFVKTEAGKKYFVYNDGTPFFYIGDTHWNMLGESFDSAGPHAGNLKTDSHFKYIVDKRVSQGYTVYQSQGGNSGTINMLDGKVNRDDSEGFQKIDKYFAYIAEKGLTHANAQFDMSPTYAFQLKDNKEGIEDITRNWVARYGAYPVMWTLGQEIDNDFYYDRGDQSHTTYMNNMWVYVAECINKYDAYNHPLTGHQEGAGHTTVTGESTGNVSPNGNKGQSVFYSDEVTKKTGHDWWGSQWGFDYNSAKYFTIAKEYWASPKVAVMYEGKYCNLWTGNFGARAQGWLAYLNGFYGYGYGAQDIWSYGNSYSTTNSSNDGYETITVETKKIRWSETIELVSGYQVGYMRQFFEKLEWWKLVPDFNTKNYFNSTNVMRYVAAHDDNNTYVVYMFDCVNTHTGTLKKMDTNATYKVQWYNPQTNEYTLINASVKPSSDGSYVIPSRPTKSDWVLLATKN